MPCHRFGQASLSGFSGCKGRCFGASATRCRCTNKNDVPLLIFFHSRDHLLRSQNEPRALTRQLCSNSSGVISSTDFQIPAPALKVKYLRLCRRYLTPASIEHQTKAHKANGMLFFADLFRFSEMRGRSGNSTYCPLHVTISSRQ